LENPSEVERETHVVGGQGGAVVFAEVVRNGSDVCPDAISWKSVKKIKHIALGSCIENFVEKFCLAVSTLLVAFFDAGFILAGTDSYSEVVNTAARPAGLMAYFVVGVVVEQS
jgi:hypothetical protein